MDTGSSEKPMVNRFFEMVAQGSLFELYDQIFSEVDTATVLEETTSVVKQIFNSECATIFIVIPETMELESITCIDNVSRKIRVPINEMSLAGYCALSRRSFVLPDAYGDLSSIHSKIRFDKSWDKLNRFQTRDVMCSPVLFNDELLGVIQVINSREGIFKDTNIPILKSVSRFVAYSLHQTRVYEELMVLKQLEKERTDFVPSIDKGLNSHISASKDTITELQLLNINDTALRSGLGRIEKRMDDMILLLKDTRKLFQVRSTGSLSNITVFDLRTESRKVYNEYLAACHQKGLKLSIQLPDYPADVRMDPHAYYLILSSLVSNAVKFTKEGLVKVELQLADPWAVVTVEDTGIGIPRREFPELFREFSRASNVVESGIAGSGVGLVLVKEIVSSLNGEVVFNSVLNKGSLFTVRLPLYNFDY